VDFVNVLWKKGKLNPVEIHVFCFSPVTIRLIKLWMIR